MFAAADIIGCASTFITDVHAICRRVQIEWTRPNKPESRPENASVVYRAVEGWPIHWCDGGGVVHACEATEIHPGCMLAWTICSKDVSEDATYVSRDLDEVTCPVCVKERWIPRDPNRPEPAWVPDYKPGNDNG